MGDGCILTNWYIVFVVLHVTQFVCIYILYCTVCRRVPPPHDKLLFQTTAPIVSFVVNRFIQVR